MNRDIKNIKDISVMDLAAFAGRGDNGKTYDYDEITFLAQRYMDFPYNVENLLKYAEKEDLSNDPTLQRFLNAVKDGADRAAAEMPDNEMGESFESLSDHICELLSDNEKPSVIVYCSNTECQKCRKGFCTETAIALDEAGACTESVC